MGGSVSVEDVPVSPGVSKTSVRRTTGRPPLAGGIGQTLATLRADLLAAGEELSDVVEPAGRTLIDEGASLLKKQVCRVAVVGQIKSGKSTFINAFTQQPGLLPTDVNPWTTAVTNLHFCQSESDASAATFEFFSEDEWQRLVDGGGKLRELTERLVPGFEPELLRQHVEALKRRAQTRLGEDFKKLLGQQHTFPEVVPNLLQKYVCSGDFADTSGNQDGPGTFADITKSANIFCDHGPFEFPVVMVDTPGTNDPFLLRDEVTRGSLESADLYIVVLTARQPLAESDVALLRILRGLNRERIVVFINRIDDLSEISRDLVDVERFVEKRIADEFPGADIPVIAGSACWASSALDDDPAAIERVFQPRALTYLVETGNLRREDLLRPASSDQSQTQVLRKALFNSSGMPEIYAAVSDLLGSSHCAYVLRQVAQYYSEMSRASENSARSELTRLNELHSATVSHTEMADQQLQHLDKEIRQLDEVTGVIEESGRNIEQQLAEILAEEITAMETAMHAKVEEHAAEERDVLIDTLSRGRAPKVWKCESIELRRELAEVFLESFKRAASRLLDLQSRIAPELHELLRMIAPGDRPPAEPDWRGLDVPAPSLASLGSFVALDLDRAWWAAWWSSKPSPEQRGDEVADLIRSEFEPIVEELLEAARIALNGYSEMTTHWSVGICNNIIQALHRRGEQFRASYNQISESVTGQGAAPETVKPQSDRLHQVETRLATCENLSQRFGEVSKAISQALNHG